MDAEFIIPLLLLVIAMLYGSVGHAGASGYIAILALCGLEAALLKPTALSLNLVVALVGTITFAHAGWFRWRLFLPFVIASVPGAFIGGMLKLPAPYYRLALGLALAYAAWRLWLASRPQDATEDVRPPAWPVALGTGALIGLASGLVGVGGGIFLSPIIMLAGWAGPRTTAAVSVAFILVNSAAGLLGHGIVARDLPPQLPLWAGCVLIGGMAGSWLGANRIPALALRRLLAGILLLAAGKMLF